MRESKHCDALSCEDVDVIVNYYNPLKDHILLYQTLHCVALYRRTGSGVILSDGSAQKDERLFLLAPELNFVYLWSEKRLSFPEGYNQGIDYSIRYSPAHYICLSANDILVNSDSISRMLRILTMDNTIGCVVPYLSYSDHPVQNDHWVKRLRDSDGMTLNVNLFRKQDLVQLGKVPEYLSGYFNDVVMFANIRKLGKRVVLCDAGHITHLGRATVNRSTMSSFLRDKTVFVERHPELAPTNPHLDVKYSVFARTRISKIYLYVLDTTRSLLLTRFLMVARLLPLKIERLFHHAEQSVYSYLRVACPGLIRVTARVKKSLRQCLMKRE